MNHKLERVWYQRRFGATKTAEIGSQLFFLLRSSIHKYSSMKPNRNVVVGRGDESLSLLSDCGAESRLYNTRYRSIYRVEEAKKRQQNEREKKVENKI